MTSCMIPRDIKILGNLKDLVGIKWPHKNSLFTPVKIMSINYDVTDYITAGEREREREREGIGLDTWRYLLQEKCHPESV